jgi:hypothetical protein
MLNDVGHYGRISVLPAELPELIRYRFFKNSSSTMVSAFVPAAIAGNSTLNLAL